MNNLNKKAQGLSLNTIIIAIIVLIVLVVLIMLFTGYFGSKFTPAVTSCENSGGICQPLQAGAARCGYDAFNEAKTVLKANCDTAGEICCARGTGVGSGPSASGAK